jgi:hypothetical protein
VTTKWPVRFASEPEVLQHARSDATCCDQRYRLQQRCCLDVEKHQFFSVRRVPACPLPLGASRTPAQAFPASKKLKEGNLEFPFLL